MSRAVIQAWETLLTSPDVSSDSFRDRLAQLMNRMDPHQPKGTPLCDAYMRQWTSNAFEAIALRGNGVFTEVYLSKRAMDDTAYPGEWHAPGSIYRSGERDRNVADRLEKEYGTAIVDFEFVSKHTTDEARGTIHSMLFLVTLGSEPRIDDRHGWFYLTDLPANTISFHRDYVVSVANYAADKDYKLRISKQVGY